MCFIILHSVGWVSVISLMYVAGPIPGALPAADP